MMMKTEVQADQQQHSVGHSRRLFQPRCQLAYRRRTTREPLAERQHGSVVYSYKPFRPQALLVDALILQGYISLKTRPRASVAYDSELTPRSFTNINRSIGTITCE